jgi:hypothetical protein
VTCLVCFWFNDLYRPSLKYMSIFLLVLFSGNVFRSETNNIACVCVCVFSSSTNPIVVPISILHGTLLQDPNLYLI